MLYVGTFAPNAWSYTEFMHSDVNLCFHQWTTQQLSQQTYLRSRSNHHHIHVCSLFGSSVCGFLQSICANEIDGGRPSVNDYEVRGISDQPLIQG